MTQLLIIRDKLIDFYTRFDYWVLPLAKLVTGIAVFAAVNANIGYAALLKSPAAVLVAALLCSFLPWCAVSLFGAVFVLGNLVQVSFEMTVIVGLVFLLFAVVMVAFRPKHSELIAILPLLYLFKIPYVVPVIAGLAIGASAVIPTAFGTLTYFMIQYFRDNISRFTAEGSEESLTEMAGKYADIINGMLKDRYFVAMLAAFCISLLVVYVIKKLAVDYAWTIAIAAGLACCVLILFLTAFAMHVTVPTVEVLVGVLLSAVVCFGYELLFYSVDYRGTERLQFEDDEYYYYVKAVPKMKVSRTNVQYRNITEE